MAQRPPRTGGCSGIRGLVSALRQLIQISTANNQYSAAIHGSVRWGAPVSVAVALSNAPACLYSGPTRGARFGLVASHASRPVTRAAVLPAEGRRGSAIAAKSSTPVVSVDSAAPAPRKAAARSAPIGIPWGSRRPPRDRPRLNDENLWLYNSAAAGRRRGPEEIGGYPLMFHMDDV